MPKLTIISRHFIQGYFHRFETTNAFLFLEQLSTTSSYEGACTSSGLNGNIHIYSSKKSTNVVKQKQKIKSKYLQIDEECKQNKFFWNKFDELFSCLAKESTSEEDSNNVTFKESFDDDISSKKNVQSHTTLSVGKQKTYPYSKSKYVL